MREKDLLKIAETLICIYYFTSDDLNIWLNTMIVKLILNAILSLFPQFEYHR